MTEPKWWDFTASKAKGNTRAKVIAVLAQLCERFAVGDEVGEGGYQHLQGRCVFKVGKDLKTLINMKLGWDWSPTHVRDFNYVLKEGNYYCSWEGPIAKWANIELRPWQSACKQRLEMQDERTVMVVVDEQGGLGKTSLARYMVATHQAVYCPPMQDAQDFMAFAMAKPAKAYIFDMPRTESAKQKVGMWSAIEQIKNGYLYDKRYHFSDMWIEPPKVLVFTNEKPPLDNLSADRWDLWGLYDYYGTVQFYPMEREQQ